MESGKFSYGVVLLAHGSSHPEAEKEAIDLCTQLSRSRPSWSTSLAYINREPALAQAMVSLKELGCRRISVLPLLVFRGKHSQEDIPGLVAAEKARHPDLTIVLNSYLSALPGFSDLLIQELDKSNTSTSRLK